MDRDIYLIIPCTLTYCSICTIYFAYYLNLPSNFKIKTNLYPYLSKTQIEEIKLLKYHCAVFG